LTCVVTTHKACSGMGYSRSSIFVAAALALSGCASVQQTVGSWFGGSATPTPAAAQRSNETFYAADAGLTVYAEPSRTAEIVGHLALHEEVSRNEIEHGYAHISASKIEGWVDNGRLLWRLPAEGAARPVAEPIPASGSSTDAPAAITASAAAVATPTPTPPDLASPTASPTQPASPPPTDTATPGTALHQAPPEIFDPY